VVDNWQGRGLGRALLSALTARARQEGVMKFYALVQAENQRPIGMLSGLGAPDAHRLGADRELTVALPPERGIGVQLSALLRAAAAGAVEAGRSVVTGAGVGPERQARRTWTSVATVLVGTDGSETAAIAVEAALDVASRFGATCHVVSVHRAASDRPAALATVTAVVERAEQQGVTAEGHAALGEPASVLIELAAQYAVDLVVVGSRGMTGAASLLGSVPNTIAHHAGSSSVLVVRTV
jgi:nucleotide-binding universal stress UspA family protein